jgi:hypothetical protein
MDEAIAGNWAALARAWLRTAITRWICTAASETTAPYCPPPACR